MSKQEKEKYDNFYVIYEGKTYNIADFINRHPGGIEILIPFRNKDITAAFHHIHHSDDAKKIMFKRLVNLDIAEKVLDADEKIKSDIKREEENDLENLGISKRKNLIKKLFTDEDPFNMHKIFGFLSIISYIYRYFFVFPQTGRLGLTNDLFSYVTLLLHTLLSISSLVFHVIRHRITENPLIIYEEYRLHAILFSLRAVFISLYGLNKQYIDEKYHQYGIVLLMLIMHLLVDYVTYKYGKPGVTAVRHEDTDKGYKRHGKRIYAFYQFAALASCLVLDENSCDLGYNTLIAIQSSAFLMTLKRKNIIKWYTHAFFYSVCLLLSYIYIYQIKGASFFYYVGIVFIARVALNFNKYILWLLFALIMNAQS